jgi:tripartite-type tricarboxylate transporter receptor subunit TctC
MMRTRLARAIAGGLCLGLAGTCAIADAKADPVADFYRGRTVTMIVSTSTGGGYDTLARAIARHLAAHIPGDPTIVVRNMPGAGGIVATNYLYATAERDGSVLGLIQDQPPLEPLFGTKQAHYDPTRFNWLGTPSVETAMVLVWHTVPVYSLDDLRRRVTHMGASGANSTPAFFGRLLNATLGTRMQIIPGFPGQNDAFLAMERGELDGYPSVFYSALSSTRPTWLPDKKARAIVQFGPEKLKQLGNVPFVPDLISNADDKLLLQVAFTPLELGRPLLMPPGVPADRVAAMRAALMQTFADPAFRAEAKKIGLEINSPRGGEQLLHAIERAYRAPPRIIARLRKLDNP